MLLHFAIILIGSEFAKASSQHCWIEGTCYGGFVTGASVADSKENCLEICQLDPECQWFTFFVSSSICTKLLTF
jgi:hypothetical protein